MGERKGRVGSFAGLSFFGLWVVFPLLVWGAETPTMVIEEAKVAIEQARQAGAERKAPDDLAQAKSWLVRAEKEYADAQTFLSRTMKLVASNEVKAREIIYLATMSRTKGQIAEAKTKKDAAIAELKDVQKDLADFQSSLEVLKKKMAEADQAKEVQSKAEAERKELDQAKQKAAVLEEQRRKEFEESQKKAAELEALKYKELQEARLQEAQRAAEREKELAEAKLKAEQLTTQKEREAAEKKSREAQMTAEKQQMAALQQKTAALEREKAMLADAGKISQATAKATDQEMVITLLAINLFTAQNELHSAGKKVLDQVGDYLKKLRRIKSRSEVIPIAPAKRPPTRLFPKSAPRK